ncbi:hypothetical protein C0J52_12804 [Blattella germanica]|nr:hypothetical protein C0J52_12804 [Blattella germanica]
MFGDVTFSLIALSVGLAIFLYYYSTRNFKYWKQQNVPYIQPLPFLGSLKDITFQKTSVGHFLKRIYDDYKGQPYVGMFSFDKLAVVVRDLDLTKQILIKESQNFQDHLIVTDSKLEPLASRNLFMLKGPKWRHMRNYLSPTFTSGKMKTMFHLVENCAKIFDNYLDSATADGNFIDVKYATSKFTTDVISSCAFGIDSNALTDTEAEFHKHLNKAFQFDSLKAVKSVALIFAPKFLTYLRMRLFEKNFYDFVRRTVWTTMDYRDKHGISRKDFLDSLRDLKNRVQEAQMDDPFQKTLRKFPPLPFLDRICARDYPFPAPSGKGTVIIPAGTAVYIPLLGLHYDPEYYPDPEKFNPERFSEENKQKRPGLTYLPFGDGPRICIGMRFGLMQAKCGLIHIISRYNVSPCKKTQIPMILDKKSFMTAAKGGINLSFQRLK